MTEIAISDRIVRHTRDAFGKPMNPHLFRDAAATTFAVADPDHVRVAAPLLGHRNFATTERYYQQAQTLQAHSAYVAAIFKKEGGSFRRSRKPCRVRRRKGQKRQERKSADLISRELVRSGCRRTANGKI
jgi:hypothetical protein